MTNFLGACAIGYILGKSSYVSVCRRKAMERLPNSNLVRGLQGLPLDPNLNRVTVYVYVVLYSMLLGSYGQSVKINNQLPVII